MEIMLYELSRYLEENRNELELPEGKRGEFRFLKAGGNPWNEGRINFLVFDEGKREPLLFIKVMRKGGENDSIDREYRIMEMIAAEDELAPFLPLPIKRISISGHRVIIQRACHGKRLLTFMSTHRTLYFQKEMIEKAFRYALTFAVPFNKLIKRQAGSGEFRKTVTEPLSFFYRTFEPSDSKNSRIASILEDVEKKMKGQPLVMPVHGDYSATNIFVEQDDRITVIDWETAIECGLPFIDLFYFMTKYIHNLKVAPRDRWQRVLHAYFSHNWFSGLIRETVQEYCRQTGFSIELARILFPLHFLIKTKIKYTMRGKGPAQLWMDLFEHSLNDEDNLCF